MKSASKIATLLLITSAISLEEFQCLTTGVVEQNLNAHKSMNLDQLTQSADIKHQAELLSHSKSESKVESKTTSAMKSQGKTASKAEVKTEAKSASKAEAKAQNKAESKAKAASESKSASKTDAKSASKGKEEKPKTITEIAGADSMDLHVTKKILEDAAEMIKSSETDDLDDLNLTTGGDHAGGQKKKEEQAAAQKKDKPEASKGSTDQAGSKQSLVQASGKGKKEDAKKDAKKDGKKGEEKKKSNGNTYDIMEFDEDNAIADEDLGIKELEANSHPVYKDMIKRFLPKKQRNHLNYYSYKRDRTHEDSWDSDKYDKEKEGIMPAEGEVDEDDFYDDHYGSHYYYDNNYYRQNDYFNYQKKEGTEKDKHDKGEKGGKEEVKEAPAKPEEKKEAAKAAAPAKAAAAQTQKPAAAQKKQAAVQKKTVVESDSDDDDEENDQIDDDVNTMTESKTHMKAGVQRDGVWNSIADTLSNDREFMKDKKQEAKTIDNLYSKQKKAIGKKGKKEMLQTTENNMEDPAAADPKDDGEAPAPATKTSSQAKADASAETAAKDTTAAKAATEETKTEKEDASSEGTGDELKKIAEKNEQEAAAKSEEAAKKEEEFQAKKDKEAKYLHARDEAQRLENEWKDLQEKTAEAKKAADEAKKIAKELKLKTGAGSETEADAADEEFGVTESPAKAAPEVSNGGISVVQFSLENKNAAELLVSKLFKNLLVGDSQIINSSSERMFMKYKKMNTEPNQVKLRLVTPDEKVPALIRFLVQNNPNEYNKDVSPDIVASKMNSGSKEYIQWIKEQTTKKKKVDEVTEALGDDDTNVQLENEKAVDDRVYVRHPMM